MNDNVSGSIFTSPEVIINRLENRGMMAYSFVTLRQVPNSQPESSRMRHESVYRSGNLL